MLSKSSYTLIKLSQRHLLSKKFSYIPIVKCSNKSNIIRNKVRYSTDVAGKFGVYDDSEFTDEFGNFEILDFETSLNKITNDFLISHGDKPIEKKALDKYWSLIIKDYESKCKFTSAESLQMDSTLLDHYFKFVSSTASTNLMASDILSRYINLLTLIKAGSIRDFSIAKGTTNIKKDIAFTDEMNLSINKRFVNVFDSVLRILNYVPLTNKSQDIPIHFFYIVYLRFLNELSFQSGLDVRNHQMKVIKFCLAEFLKNKDSSLNKISDINLKRFQKIQYSSLSTHSKTDSDDIESIRALQKCIIYRILITQDEKIISNVWDSINFRTGYYKDNIIENWNIFIEQMEKVFMKDQTPMSDAMKVYASTHLLSMLTEDLITFSENKIPEGKNLIKRLKSLIK
ncbi:uncharacterized protein HGUI_03171 [Hanseniaspora guilliermondii]|uniref:Uncharacterized protein n=1 Tax=Hanseniaspora guilliermondii TaxID=56406 RepID=A0A1L0B7B1_9ASCO|nr:uncharacterized protein HGUI_03171 [Hanseniaspora guilliermondii]